MSTTYLTLVNNVLNELNESEVTSTTFSSSRGIQTSVKKFVTKAMHEIYNSVSEILMQVKENMLFLVLHLHKVQTYHTEKWIGKLLG